MISDAIVVGAGPPGASTAYWLGEGGARTVVPEKEKLPRYKPCGGGVPPAVFDQSPFDERSSNDGFGRYASDSETVARLSLIFGIARRRW